MSKRVGSFWRWISSRAGYAFEQPPETVQIVEQLPGPGVPDRQRPFPIPHHQSPTRRYEYVVATRDGSKFFANEDSLETVHGRLPTTWSQVAEGSGDA